MSTKKYPDIFTADKPVTVVGYDEGEQVFLFEHTCIDESGEEIFFHVAFRDLDAIKVFADNLSTSVEIIENYPIDTLH